MSQCTAHVRFRGQSGHDLLRRTCPGIRRCASRNGLRRGARLALRPGCIAEFRRRFAELINQTGRDACRRLEMYTPIEAGAWSANDPSRQAR